MNDPVLPFSFLRDDWSCDATSSFGVFTPWEDLPPAFTQLAEAPSSPEAARYKLYHIPGHISAQYAMALLNEANIPFQPIAVDWPHASIEVVDTAWPLPALQSHQNEHDYHISLKYIKLLVREWLGGRITSISTRPYTPIRISSCQSGYSDDGRYFTSYAAYGHLLDRAEPLLDCIPYVQTCQNRRSAYTHLQVRNLGALDEIVDQRLTPTGHYCSPEQNAVLFADEIIRFKGGEICLVVNQNDAWTGRYEVYTDAYVVHEGNLYRIYGERKAR